MKATSTWLILFIFTILPLKAEVTGFYLWQPLKDGPRILVPIVSTKSKVEIENQIIKSTSLKGTTDIKRSRFSIREHLKLTSVVTNRPGQMNGHEEIVKIVHSELRRHNTDMMMIPVGMENLLSDRELKVFHDFIVKKSSVLVLLGGADIHPSLYGERITGARDLNRQRDIVELSLLNNFLKNSNGIVVGFCRGNQLIGVSQGAKLIQDIPTRFKLDNPSLHSPSREHANDRARQSSYHQITLAQDSLLERIFKTSTIEVNSRHHQSIDFSSIKSNSSIRVTAVESINNIVEAIEFKNGRGYGFQFHPEDMQTNESREILSRVFSKKDRTFMKLHKLNCAKVFL